MGRVAGRAFSCWPASRPQDVRCHLAPKPLESHKLAHTQSKASSMRYFCSMSESAAIFSHLAQPIESPINSYSFRLHSIGASMETRAATENGLLRADRLQGLPTSTIITASHLRSQEGCRRLGYRRRDRTVELYSSPAASCLEQTRLSLSRRAAPHLVTAITLLCSRPTQKSTCSARGRDHLLVQTVLISSIGSCPAKTNKYVRGFKLKPLAQLARQDRP
ncbi:hypothetical protein LIA77_04660 [Sarocladium implicatum]|nr:hypothetical protein LIA77_04660 [Sarocladium implicatum]